MRNTFLQFNILAIALPFLRTSPRTWLVAMGILATVLLGTGALLFNVMYFQSIGSGLSIFSELFNDFHLEIFTSQLLASSSLLGLSPVAPAENNEPKQEVNLPAFAAKAPKVFLNPSLERKEISSYLKGKSGVYCFWNKSNGKYYVGSGVELSRRINLYFQISWLMRHSNMIIVNSILKYKMDNFVLIILEFCDRDNLLSRETQFISTLDPAYNIYKTAGSPLGYKHSLQSIAKIRDGALGRMFSEETIGKMTEAAKNRWSTGQPGFTLSVLDLVTNVTTEYLSIAEAARKLTLSRSAITRRLNKEITTTFKYKARYEITVKRPK
jgi:hypothetical protein